VQSGDTLWSLCDSYYRDPWQWPRLWSMNPQVTNPHWIFPGDVVKLHDGAGASGSGGVRPAPAAAVAFKSNRPGTLGSRAVLLRELGFIEANALEGSAQIAGSREEKIMLATGDQAYVSFTKEQPLKAGERYTIFAADKERPVKNPENGQVLGYLVRVLGDLVVDQIAERNMARGTLVDLVEPVERGATVSPFIRQFKRLEPQASQVNLEARVLAAFSPANMLAAETFVVLGRGRKDGVQVGNRSFVVRRGDGYRPIMEGWDTFDGDFPKEVVGELWVVDVRETSAIAWIARSTKEIRVGEITELRKGH
jgi:hypothetical protein